MLPFSQACERNQKPILEVLRICFDDRTQVLEIGSGTGQHAVYFSRALSHLTWHPTEQPAHLADLALRVKLEGPGNLQAPLALDVTQALWPVPVVDALFTANTLHIMSWPEVIALFRGAGGVLQPGGRCCVYGAFRYHGRYTSDSNQEFDRMLQNRDPKSGLRDIQAVTALAAQYGLRLDTDHDLPAHNRLLVFVKERG
ncbi:MAG: class I SAM-dependent methyltransferase [Pseudomonadota bacterium]|nr:class I SAM-dependent methyltransferase [Pseudomonadota bacterium]